MILYARDGQKSCYDYQNLSTKVLCRFSGMEIQKPMTDHLLNLRLF